VTILTKLSNLVPNSLLTLEYEEETGWGGEYEILRGEVKELISYENRCYACDSYDTNDYCDECQINVCSECLDFSEADPDDVAQCQTHAVQLTQTKGN
ncbi:hypothetical protein EBQ93_00830, partial [bacterium]|nr:hypothetical protein [bacterium]